MENTGLNSSVENVIISTAKPTIKYKNFNDFQKNIVDLVNLKIPNHLVRHIQELVIRN